MDNKEEGKTGLVGDIPIFFDPKNEFHYQKLKSAREKEVEKLVDRMCISCQHLGSDHWHGYGACVHCACTQFFAEYEHKDPLKKLEEERRKIYGDPFLSHQAIGLAFEAVFRNRYHFMSEWLNKNYPELLGKLFPADLMATEFAGFKIVRDARPVFHKDSGDDAKVYIDFSQRFREGK